jgi:L-rhamnose isomerase/sugar isomerase
VLWDLPNGVVDVPEVKKLEKRFGVRSGSINPNLFQDQEYKYGSLCNPSAEIRQRALDHMLDSIAIAKQVESRDISLWMADGSNYPGTQSMRKRIGWLEEALRISHSHLAPNQRLLVEYKPFEPAIWHGKPGRRRGCWWTRATTTTRRTSNRLWRGCCTPKCWAGSTSTTGAMPTTI